MDKYTQYAHGDPRKERRVVLERDLLGQINLAGNIRVVDKTILPEQVVKPVEDEVRYAKRDRDTLIILVFGHGNQDNHGVYIGGKDPTADSAVLKS
ncbi:hypothetical protein Aspvir_008746 [Aspergillus viridinutans]|uniref:Uncharacterized protein n=1 Tax=Aspergillus viridinutans TaxID=75553 RepID=A0A9P3BY77_ASPVI|nr:uncharacterized protein Aspvir_008746 [Aspergillus viridinutans]GIK04658.1 hypothetical protein Aspvir_008746 [Aspergillus viridinutans]